LRDDTHWPILVVDDRQAGIAVLLHALLGEMNAVFSVDRHGRWLHVVTDGNGKWTHRLPHFFHVQVILHIIAASITAT
jgi:hypothetical protein